MNVNLLDNFEATVEKKQTALAVCHNGQEISFKRLANCAKALGYLLSRHIQGKTNYPIAVFLPKNINAVIADLGIMYSANPFMNLDVKMPVERLNNIFKLIEPQAVVTDSKFKNKLPEMDIPVIIIDKINYDDINIDETQLEQLRKSLIGADPFCLINTSGSTGVPKSVVLSHRGFFDYLAATNKFFNFNGSEIIGSLSPIVFDHFVYEFCMLLSYGSQLVLLDAAHSSFPIKLLETLVNMHVNYIFWVPSIMVTIANLNLLKKIRLPELKLAWFAGEVFPTKQFLYWYDNLPHVKFVNLYGPVEITLDCTIYEITERPPENAPLPIGKPLENVDIIILNEHNKRCEINEEGEICVRSSSIAMGYYNNPEKTVSAFTQNPLNKSYPEIIYHTGDIGYRRPDGNIMFKGRRDSLIKHMGIRIELGEIEHALENSLKLVDYCCAVYREKQKEIVLYYESEDELTPKDFRTALSKIFPSYMIPAVYEKLSELPRNTNGKIDRLTLKKRANDEN